MTANSNEELDDIPEHDKREADKETKGAAKVWDQGVKRVDEVFPQHICTQGAVGEDNPKHPQRPQVCSHNPVLVKGAREKTSSLSLNECLIHSCKFEIILLKQVKLISCRAGFVPCKPKDAAGNIIIIQL